MFTLTGKRLIVITPEEADDILRNKNIYDSQRPYDPRHAALLKKKMRTGKFLAGLVIFAHRPDGSSLLVNAQHQLESCRQTGLPFDAAVYDYFCATEQDVYELFSEIDQGKRRSQSDIVRACRGTLPASLREISLTALAQYGAAILLSDLHGVPVFQTRMATPHDRVAAVRAHSEEALYLHEFQAAKHFNRIPVRMAMVAAYRIDPDRARLFWNGVADPDRLPAADVRRLLHDRLMRVGGRGKGTTVEMRRLYAACVNHWNAHATGGDPAEYQDDDLPSVMAVAAPVPTLATVKLPPQATKPATQTFTASLPGVVRQAAEASTMKQVPASATA